MFVKQWEEKTTKVNFFSMYFVQTKEEIHLSFKNSEKQWTQALRGSCTVYRNALESRMKGRMFKLMIPKHGN